MTASASQHLRRRDRALAAIMRRAVPCTLAPEPGIEPWQALVRSVVYQQLHGTAAGAIFNRLLAVFPRHQWPPPEVLAAWPEASLRDVGLSRAKALAIKEVAAQTVAGVVPNRRQIRRLSDAEIMARLTLIRGVGPWTVEMLLMFTLGRLDVLPATDYGVRNGFALIHGLKELPTPKELLTYGERWRPYRSVAAWSLWRAVDLARERQRPET